MIPGSIPSRFQAILQRTLSCAGRSTPTPRLSFPLLRYLAAVASASKTLAIPVPTGEALAKRFDSNGLCCVAIRHGNNVPRNFFAHSGLF